MRTSIVIAAYNEEKYIESCIKSLLNQTVPADEIIVVNNNSTDNTEDIIRKYPVTLINEENQGIIPARNTGFDLAKYELILRTDADTIVPSDWVGRMSTFFENNKCDAVVGTVLYFDSLAKVNKQIYSNYLEGIKHILGSYPLIGPNMALTSEIWKKIRKIICTDEKIVHEDVDLSIHINEINGVIMYDKNNCAVTSKRRIIYQPQSFFLEYSHRLLKMKLAHLKHR
ncbi:glycosyltransferase family 2 protein [Candidatus Roizmanbacteria bacterium CG_4_10_14_0_2_um_filter_36_9]|uniref:Glycosyltransferase family 2 protein n=1 Tax=Candidatus Roizmanbacteria bacterium CG_4_10_14_0_2_um_filter_36_9 TaxID=1974823 RepID=A0A2M7U3F2_9BACT|nr:MAG: glycosyltransferase family 2 protein [Candidatus Roizmanbacteria bacterium CG_4_10_14_0_2_um_filter_36_9]